MLVADLTSRVLLVELELFGNLLFHLNLSLSLNVAIGLELGGLVRLGRHLNRVQILNVS